MSIVWGAIGNGSYKSLNSATDSIDEWTASNRADNYLINYSRIQNRTLSQFACVICVAYLLGTSTNGCHSGTPYYNNRVWRKIEKKGVSVFFFLYFCLFVCASSQIGVSPQVLYLLPDIIWLWTVNPCIHVRVCMRACERCCDSSIFINPFLVDWFANQTKQQWNGYKFDRQIDRLAKTKQKNNIGWMVQLVSVHSFLLMCYSFFFFFLVKTSRWSRANRCVAVNCISIQIHLNRLVFRRAHRIQCIRLYSISIHTVAKSFCWTICSLKVCLILHIETFRRFNRMPPHSIRFNSVLFCL